MKRELLRILLIATVVFLVGSNSFVAAQSTFDFDSQGVGLKLNADGVGLYGLGTGTANIGIDIGGEVSYAVLVWGGLQDGDCTASNCGDSEMVFEGSPITGESIGKEFIPDASYNHTAAGYGYDVTSLVQSAYSGPGSYTFTLADGNVGDDLEFLSGATLFVVFTDAGDATVSRVQLKFETDYAFYRFEGDAGVIEPIVFPITPGVNAGEGQYFLVNGEAEPQRPDIVRIDGNEFCDAMVAGDGLEWDTLSTTQTPSGTETTIEIISDTCASSPLTAQPDSLVVLGAGFALPVAPTMDFGDLPESFVGITTLPTGARHLATELNLTIGVVKDLEFDGIPNAAALGDDLDQVPDDEEGVYRPAGSNWSDGQGELTVAVGVDGPVEGFVGCLTGWLDFHDGADGGPNFSFDDADEYIIQNVAVVTGENQLTFPLPLGVADDATFFGRFRLVPLEGDVSEGFCTQTAIDYVGFADGGEVEDHVFVFGPTAVSLAGFSADSPSLNIQVIVFLTAVGILSLVALTLASFAVRKIKA
jgi:hypothetical protein